MCVQSSLAGLRVFVESGCALFMAVQMTLTAAMSDLGSRGTFLLFLAAPQLYSVHDFVPPLAALLTK